jgi:predicted Zn-dependent protease
LTHTNLGNDLHTKKELEGAFDEYKTAIALDPKAADHHRCLGMALQAKGDLEGAIAEFKTAIALDPTDAVPHNELGTALADKKDLEGAIKEYKTAIALDSKWGLPHYNLGNALKAKKDIQGAIDSYKTAIALDPDYAEAHYNLGLAHRQLGQFTDALKEMKLGHALGSKQPGWPYPSALLVKQCEQLLALDQRLAAIQQGQAQPVSAVEQFALAQLCQGYKKQYAAAAKFYAAAFLAAPNLTADPTKPWRYNAACAAALAAAGQGEDAGTLEAPAKAKLRQQALAWLKADLALWQRHTTGAEPAALPKVAKALAHWQTNPDLAGVRDDKALAQLPDGERKDWQTLWADVAQLLHKANPGAARGSSRKLPSLVEW